MSPNISLGPGPQHHLDRLLSTLSRYTDEKNAREEAQLVEKEAGKGIAADLLASVYSLPVDGDFDSQSLMICTELLVQSSRGEGETGELSDKQREKLDDAAKRAREHIGLSLREPEDELQRNASSREVVALRTMMTRNLLSFATGVLVAPPARLAGKRAIITERNPAQSRHAFCLINHARAILGEWYLIEREDAS